LGVCFWTGQVKNISKAELKGNKEVLENLSNSDEVLSYNEPIENEQI